MSGLTTTVDRHRLLARLQANRVKHVEEYEKAKEGYIRVLRVKLNEELDRLEDGKLPSTTNFDIPPQDHTQDYDEAIQMMEWNQAESIELTQSQFRQYVMDEWGWKDHWTASTTAYIAAAGR